MNSIIESYNDQEMMNQSAYFENQELIDFEK